MTNFKDKTKKDVLITPQVFSDMLRGSDTPWVRSLLVYLYLFGVRITEAVRLNRSDLVIEALDGVEYLVSNSPTVKNRKVHSRRLYIPLDAPHMDILLSYMRVQGDERMWRYSRGWAWKKVTDLNEDISPHIFRHNRLTRLAQNEATAFQIQSFAGHSDLRPASAYIQISGVMTLRMVERIKVI